MIGFRYWLLLTIALSGLQAADPPPETAAAFDRYIQITEDGFAKHQGFEDFLWLDHHPNEKTMVWLQQTIIKPIETLDQGKEIEVPGGVIQHWLGVTYLENVDANGVGAMVLNWADYKNLFKEQIIDSKLTLHQAERADMLLRFSLKQWKTAILNVDVTSKYHPVDPARWWVACHSTHIGEAEHPKNKKNLDEERAPEDTPGYLWRLNFYWRVQQADNGCYVELEVISLAQEEAGRLHPTRYLAGFQNFPHELTQYLIDTLEGLFPHHK